MKKNLLLNTDSYKTSHFLQYPSGTEYVSSYIESRGGEFPISVFFGLQMFLKEYLSRPITLRDIDEAEQFWKLHGEPFNRSGWMHILNQHGGRLPIRIQAVPEGTVLGVKNVLVQIVNTDPKVPWLTSFLETALLRAIWYPTTVATQSWMIKQDILRSLEKTADDPAASIGFKLHDFGARGVSSFESAGIGGAAHLINFLGTDTVTGVIYANRYYGENMAGYSIPAAEHSTITSWGGPDQEIDAFRNMLDQFAGKGPLVAVVSDSYDIYRACRDLWGTKLKAEVEALGQKGTTLVVRPDCYDEKTEILTEHGWKKFNDLEKGEKVVQILDDGSSELVFPTAYIKQDYSGPMYKFTDKKGRLDLLVTPNHRMITTDWDGSLITQEAESAIFHWKKSIPRVCASSVPGDTITPYERFLIAFQADGSYPSGYDKIENPGIICGHVRVRFNFQKRRKQKRLIALCQEANLQYEIRSEPARKLALDQDVVYVNVPIKHSLSKMFDWVNPAARSKSWCVQFIEELSHWDSTRRSDTRIKYDTTVEFNADVVHQVAMFGGFGCTYAIHEDHRSERFSDVHSLTITDKIVINGQAVIRERVENFSGTIYCVRVPSGRIVVRRNKAAVVCGNSGDPTIVPVECIEILMDQFGSTVNTKGYRMLPPYLRVIQGDGVNRESIRKILENLEAKKISTDNIAFGMGGALLQNLNRDTMKFAMKASAIMIHGKWNDVFKNPVTDPGKVSKKGRLALFQDESGTYYTGEERTALFNGDNKLRIVYENGYVLVNDSFADIRARAQAGRL